MKKRILFGMLAGIMLVSACGPGKQKDNTNTDIIDNQISIAEKEETSSDKEPLVNTISQSEIKNLLKQYFEDIGDCSFTITTIEKFHVTQSNTGSNAKTPVTMDDNDSTVVINNDTPDEYDVSNTGTVTVTKSRNWFHVRSDIDHQIMDMNSPESNEFYIEKTDDGYVFYGYDRDSDESTYTPLSAVTRMESTDILKTFLSDNVKIVDGKTVTDEKGKVTGYTITMNMSYSDYYAFFIYGSTLSEPEIPSEMENETATAKIEFDKSGKLKQIEITPDQSSDGSDTTDGNSKLTVLEESISIKFADTVPGIDVPTGVLKVRST